MAEILPIAIMYGCAFMLAPFIAGAMYVAFDGDRRRERGELLGAVDPRVAARYAGTRTTARVVELPLAERQQTRGDAVVAG